MSGLVHQKLSQFVSVEHLIYWAASPIHFLENLIHLFPFSLLYLCVCLTLELIGNEVTLACGETRGVFSVNNLCCEVG